MLKKILLSTILCPLIIYAGDEGGEKRKMDFGGELSQRVKKIKLSSDLNQLVSETAHPDYFSLLPTEIWTVIISNYKLKQLTPFKLVCKTFHTVFTNWEKVTKSDRSQKSVMCLASDLGHTNRKHAEELDLSSDSFQGFLNRFATEHRWEEKKVTVNSIEMFTLHLRANNSDRRVPLGDIKVEQNDLGLPHYFAKINPSELEKILLKRKTKNGKTLSYKLSDFVKDSHGRYIVQSASNRFEFLPNFGFVTQFFGLQKLVITMIGHIVQPKQLEFLHKILQLKKLRLTESIHMSCLPTIMMVPTLESLNCRLFDESIGRDIYSFLSVGYEIVAPIEELHADTDMSCKNAFKNTNIRKITLYGGESNTTSAITDENISLLMRCVGTNTSIMKFCARGFNFSSGSAKSVAEMLTKNSTLQSLKLEHSLLDKRTLACFCDIEDEQINNTLKSFSLSIVNRDTCGHNLDVPEVDEFYYLFSKLKKIKSLEKFSLNVNESKLYIKAVTSSLKQLSQLKELNLSRITIPGSGLYDLQRYLSKNTSLQKVDLTECDLIVFSVLSILEALCVNKTLKDISLRKNKIDDTIWKPLEYILKSNSTLRYLDLRDNNLKGDEKQLCPMKGINKDLEVLFINTSFIQQPKRKDVDIKWGYY